MAASREVIVYVSETGLRLDQLLARRLKDVSRTQLKQRIESGHVTLNGAAAIPRQKVRAGDRISVREIPAVPSSLDPEAIPLQIVYEDEHLAVIDKPAGLVVHPGSGVKSGTLANALAHHFRTPSASGQEYRPGIVHRLDKGTSGLMVVAKTQEAWLNLARQFRDRSVTKRYLALVYGLPRREQGTIEAAIGRHPYRRTQMAVRPEGKGRKAVTVYQVIERLPGFALIELTIKTGRTHQIRVHLAHIGTPVVGDGTYGGAYISKVRDRALLDCITKMGRPFLHAFELEFAHPVNGDRRRFKSKLPEELAGLLQQLKQGQAGPASVTGVKG